MVYFGTATESDLEGLRKQINNLAVNQNDLVHAVENGLSMLNKTNTLASQNNNNNNNIYLKSNINVYRDTSSVDYTQNGM